MNKDEMRVFLSGFLEQESTVLGMPTADDWHAIEEYFSTEFSIEFKAFIDLMSEFAFPGDVFNAASLEDSNGNDLITEVYELERQNSNWPKNCIPFYGIGNGDFFVVNARDNQRSPVYYLHHEDGQLEKYSDSFQAWVEHLPSFLNGE